MSQPVTSWPHYNDGSSLTRMRKQNKNLPGWALRCIALRVSRKWSQREAGELLGWGKGGTAQTRVMYMEKGREPSNENLEKIAALYGVSVAYILLGEAASTLQPTAAIQLLAWDEMKKRNGDHKKNKIIEVPQWLAPIGPRSFAVVLPDDLYAPVFMQGDIVFVDPDAKAAVGNHVVVELSPTTYCVCSVVKSGSRVKLHILDKRLNVPSQKLSLSRVVGVIRRRLQTL